VERNVLIRLFNIGPSELARFRVDRSALLTHVFELFAAPGTDTLDQRVGGSFFENLGSDLDVTTVIPWYNTPVSLCVQVPVLRAEAFLEHRSQLYKTGAALPAHLLVSVEPCLDVSFGMVEADVLGAVAAPFSTHGTFLAFTSRYITFTFEFPFTLGTYMRLLFV